MTITRVYSAISGKKRRESMQPPFHISLMAPKVVDWLSQGGDTRIVSLFPNSCNMSYGDGEIISIVTEAIGPGPFHMVLQPPAGEQSSPVNFISLLSRKDSVHREEDTLALGSLTIDLEQSKVWSPVPAWSGVQLISLSRPLSLMRRILQTRTRSESLANIITGEPLTRAQQKSREGWLILKKGLNRRDPDLISTGTSRLAGLGIGLTPSGDDFLMGVLYGIWLSKEPGKALDLCQHIVGVAAPRTTSFSAAWLRAAASGEASQHWHKLMKALSSRDDRAILHATNRFFAIGHTSGEDALAGFIAYLCAEFLE